MENNILSINKFLNDLTARNSTATAVEMRAYLLAFNKVRSALTELKIEGLQVLEADSVESYELGLGKQEKPVPTLDFILRKENVELQLDVKYSPSGTLFLTRQDLERYHSVLARSAKTEEILVVWANGDLPTFIIDLSVIQHYLSSMKGLRTSIKTSLLKPLQQAVVYAFEQHRPIWIKPAEIVVSKVPYDIRGLFTEAIIKRIEEVKATLGSRRSPDRKKAIESITDYDIKTLKRIFDNSQTAMIDSDYIEQEFRKLSSYVDK